ncbi:MAG: SUMF1/EgtB/PvdO family nonheme iron enzyme [Myxococcales bacterium]|nr:SUMF1/EgtB/PvdO family nonheme iron enzyme [Myxococcales bacterium]
MLELEEAEWTPPDEFDEYRIVRQLGRGSMGSVYLAHDVVLDRPVAMKFLGALRPDPIERDRFLVEARAVARIHHPNVMSIFRVGEVKGRLYLVTEYVRGENLADLELPLPSAKVAEIGVGLARGLAAAHRQGVLHRDIKLSNAVIDDAGEVKLLDFGLAKLVDATADRGDGSPSASTSQGSPVDENTADHLMKAAANARQMMTQRFADTMKLEPTSATSPTPKVDRGNERTPKADPPPGDGATPPAGSPALRAPPAGIDRERFGAWHHTNAAITRAGTVMGTPHYMAPELWLADPASRRSDVYALGVVLYILASARPPHDAESPFELAMQVQEGDPPKLREIAPNVDAKLADVIDRCLLRDPYERYAAGDELRTALEMLAAPARPSASVPTGNPYRGLQAFEAEHRSLFFGRTAEVRSVVDRLRTDSFVVVAGDSGVGKSSLCRAGVIPSVLEGDLDPSKTWRTVTMTPGRYPRQSFVSVISRGFGLSEDEVSDLLAQEPEALVRALRRQLGDTGGCLIFLDQFEEFVTIAEPSEVEVIGPMVVRLLAGIPGLRVLATVRGDFLTRVVTVPGLGDEVSRGIFLLRPLSPDGAREAIVGPARVNGVSFESDDLVDELVAAGVKGSLPLLQFALAELWESRDKSASVITEVELRKIGGVTGALARHADGVIASLLPNQRSAARRLLMRLVTLDNTRASLTEDELVANDEASKAALDALVRGRLLVVKEAGDRMVYEIAHEALVGGWTQLAGWLEDEMEARAILHRLEQAAAEWERLGRGREGLWSAAQVAEASVLERGTLREREREFIRASSANANRIRNLRRAAIISVPAFVIAAYGLFWVQSQSEIQERVNRHVNKAEALISTAEREWEQLDRLRGQAFSLFDLGQRDDGERLWAQVIEHQPQISGRFFEASQELETALGISQERDDVRRLLARTLFERARFLDEQGQRALVPDLLARLELHDVTGEWIAEWQSPGALRLRTRPSVDTVRVARYEDTSGGGKELAEFRTVKLEGAPIALAAGSYLLDVGGEGHSSLLYPLSIGRGEELTVEVDLASSGAIPTGYVYIPAGRFLIGFSGDEDLRQAFYETVPLHQGSTGSYVISKHETTIGEYLEYLDELDDEKREVHQINAEGSGIGDSMSVRRGEDNTWEIEWRFGGVAISARDGEDFVYERRSLRSVADWRKFPISGVSAHDVSAFLEWLDKSGRLPGARFCTEAEWERASRGADGRLYPHGNSLDGSEANVDSTYDHNPAAMGPDMVGSYPASSSPFGLLDASGNVFEWVVSKVDGTYLVKGGSFYYPPIVARTVNRQVFPEETRSVHVGFRVCADYPLR